MKENPQTLQKLPLPNWCFVLLGVPTFYMPLAYLALAVWAIEGMFTGVAGAPPEWMMTAMRPALYVTFGMWPVYIAWVGLSKRLAWREKGLWLFIVILFNMHGDDVWGHGRHDGSDGPRRLGSNYVTVMGELAQESLDRFHQSY